MSELVRTHASVCKAIASLFPGFAEVVLHDLKSGRIVHIEGGFSQRRVGDDSLIERAELEDEITGKALVGPYRKTSPDGARVRSVTAVLRDANERSHGLLCVNIRIDALEAAANLLTALTSPESLAPAGALLRGDWQERANEVIAQSLRRRGTSVATAVRADRLDAVAALDRAELFEVRGSADYIAAALSVSRATVYALLRRSRERASASQAESERGAREPVDA